MIDWEDEHLLEGLDPADWMWLGDVEDSTLEMWAPSRLKREHLTRVLDSGYFVQQYLPANGTRRKWTSKFPMFEHENGALQAMKDWRAKGERIPLRVVEVSGRETVRIVKEHGDG